jgi:hypothetical protein
MKPGDLAELRANARRLRIDEAEPLYLFARSGFDRNLHAGQRLTLVGLPDLFRADLDYEHVAADRSTADMAAMVDLRDEKTVQRLLETE